MKKGILLLFLALFSFMGVYAIDDTEEEAMKNRVGIVQNPISEITNISQETQKGLIGNIISSLFNNSGKIRTPFIYAFGNLVGNTNGIIPIWDNNQFRVGSIREVAGNVFITGDLTADNFYKTDGSPIGGKFVDGAADSRDAVYTDRRVGIGTDSPETKLHVVGNTRIDGGLILQAGVIDGTEIANGTIQSQDIQNFTIEGVDIAPDSIGTGKIIDDSIRSSDVRNNSLTADDLANNSVGNAELINNPTVTTIYADNWYRSIGNSGWYNQTYQGGIYMIDTTWVRLYNNKRLYTGGLIRADDGFQVGTTTVIGSDAYIEGSRIRPDSIGSGKIANGAIKSADIANGTITGSDISQNTIGFYHIGEGAVRSSEILDGTIRSIDISDGTITGTDISNGSITGADIANGSLGTADIANGSVTTTDIANGTIQKADLNPNLYSSLSSIGVGQDWRQQLLNANQSYRNTTGKPIMVNAFKEIGSSGTWAFYVSSNGSSWLMVHRTSNKGDTQVSIIVPPGHYYKSNYAVYAQILD